MAHQTPLPLSQQIVAWVLQAMGRANDLVDISPGTRKNAHRGAPIPQRWDSLINELSHAVGSRPTPEQQEGFRQWLRGYDERVGTLKPMELSFADRLPAVLEVAVPAFGCWVGSVLACFEEGLLNDDARATVPELARWVSEPLSPLVFTRMFRALVLFHRPGRTREERRSELSRVISRNTFDRWWDGDVELPNAEAIKGVHKVLGGEHRTTLLLQSARLLQSLRAELVTWYESEEAVDRVSETVTRWAEAARDTLRAPGDAEWRRDLLGLVLAGLEGPISDSVASIMQVGHPTVLPKSEFAEQLRRMVAADGHDAERRRATAWASLWGMGHPILRASAGYAQGMGTTPAGLLSDRWQELQFDWIATAMLQGAAKEHVPDLPDGVRAAARSYLVERRALVATVEGVRRKSELQNLLLRIADIDPRLVPQAEVDARLTLPAPMEVALPDDVVAAVPHLGAHRIHRLIHGGRVAEGLSWYVRLSKAKVLRLSLDRDVVAKALIEGAHRLLDDARSGENANDGDEWATHSQWESFVRARHLASRLFMSSSKLLDLRPDSLDYADALAHLLPLAIRLDMFVDDDSWPRAGVLAANLLERDTERFPTHGALWACAAIWCRLNELGDAGLKERHAAHFGAQAVLDLHWMRLVDDARFVQG